MPLAHHLQHRRLGRHSNLDGIAAGCVFGGNRQADRIRINPDGIIGPAIHQAVNAVVIVEVDKCFALGQTMRRAKVDPVACCIDRETAELDRFDPFLQRMLRCCRNRQWCQSQRGSV